MLKNYKIIFFKRIATLIVLHIWCSSLNGQNLIKNPSFEEFKACPSEYGCLEEVVPSWSQPTEGSSDYFNSCSIEMSTESNFIGLQTPFDGFGYAGMYAYAAQDYREYLTAEIKQRLIKGQKYIFSLQISLAEESQFAVNGFGILFTAKELDLHTKRNIPMEQMRRHGYKNYIQMRDHRFYAEKDNWIELMGIYVADGTEKYMTFGNFKNNQETRTLKTGINPKKAAYYFVDMLSLKPVDEEFKLDEVYVLSNLKFKVDGHSIDTSQKDQLDNLVAYLKAHRGYNVTIHGHTDNAGSKSYNKELSQKRAKSVAKFLVENGLGSNRIVWRGFGDNLPVAKNETEVGREKNRRVEFIVSKKKLNPYASSVFEDDN